MDAAALQHETCPTGSTPGCPAHIGLILDGNRRWARGEGISPAEGYRRGADKVVEVLGWCEEAGAAVTTLWALSQRNLGRSRAEIGGLLAAITAGLTSIASVGRWRVTLIGRPELLPHEAARTWAAIVASTARATGMRVNVAVGYDGREEILSAVRAMAAEWLARGAGADDVRRELTEEHFSRYLSTAGQPDPDLVIRTAGEHRLSGFMPWQTVRSELYFCPVGWPDFTRDHLEDALRAYSTRERRFGL